MSGNTDAKAIPASAVAPTSARATSRAASGSGGRGPRSRSAHPTSASSSAIVDSRSELIDHRRPEEVIVDLVRLLEIDEVADPGGQPPPAPHQPQGVGGGIVGVEPGVVHDPPAAVVEGGQDPRGPQ